MGDLSSLLTNMAQLEIKKIGNDDVQAEKVSEDSEDIPVDIPSLNNDIKDCSSTRSLRKRSASDDSLHRTRNRKVMKPKKNTNGAVKFETEKQVKNFYLNINKKVKMKPVLLETIYEKDETLSDFEEESTSKSSGRKVKRALALCDGLNITKSLKEKRKGLIKKHLGGKKKPKRMALAKFMEYFKQKVTESD